MILPRAAHFSALTAPATLATNARMVSPLTSTYASPTILASKYQLLVPLVRATIALLVSQVSTST